MSQKQKAKPEEKTRVVRDYLSGRMTRREAATAAHAKGGFVSGFMDFDR